MASALGDSIDKLYKNYDILSDAKEKITEHEKEYKEILDAVKGSDKEKQLAAQFIGKFFKHFPSLADVAIDASLDLCEDENVQIRRQAIKNLPQLCKETKEHVPRIADILAQLLIVDDGVELQQVHLALETVMATDPKGTFAGLFCQIGGGDELTRDRCLKYLQAKLKKVDKELINAEVEAYIIVELKKVLQDVTSEEFEICMNILGGTKLGVTITGHSELVALAIEQSEINVDVDPLLVDDELVERFIQCATHALPYFSTQIEATPFVKFACTKFFPLSTWKLIGATEADSQDLLHLRLLKVFAEMTDNCPSLEKSNANIEAVYNVLQEYMPLPSLDADLAEEIPTFKFSQAECLLYALHKLGKSNEEFFQFDSDAAKLKDFRSRLQYLARGTQGYIKKLQEVVKSPAPAKDDEAANADYKIKTIALKTTSNISTLIRDLFHNPPIFRSPVVLSWIITKPTGVNKTVTGKRHAPITFGSAGNGAAAKKKREANKPAQSPVDQRLYKTPSGKYSGKVSNYSNNSRQRNNRNNQGKNKSFRKY